MGTVYRVSVVVSPEQFSDPALRSNIELEINQRLNAINQLMSHYIPDSDLNILNAAPIKSRIDVAPELADVLAQAYAVSLASGGAFDVTLSPVIDAWGFGPSGDINERPNDDYLQRVAAQVGFEHYTVEGNVVYKAIEGLKFNLSAIAKGYAVDRLATYLKTQGYSDHLVDIGGELRASGKNSDDVEWRVGIEKPSVLGGVDEIIMLSEKAIATSGDYRNYVEIDGQRYSHTIDPTSLSPVLHRLASVSLVHDSATFADAFATAILALGEVKGLELARTNNLSFYAMIRTTGEQYKVVMSDDFDVFLIDKSVQALDAGMNGH